MSRLQVDHRPCTRPCEKCKEWKHHSRFHSKEIRNGTVAKVYFHKWCRDCEQIKRNERKNADRPLAIIRGRAQTAGTKAGTPTEFFWIDMNYQGLVRHIRSAMAAGSKCDSCGEPFLHERDMQIDHILPPRHQQDWARMHMRNLRLLCQSCNTTKGSKSFADWLDEQEGARLSNLESQKSIVRTIQGPLFEEEP